MTTATTGHKYSSVDDWESEWVLTKLMPTGILFKGRLRHKIKCVLGDHKSGTIYRRGFYQTPEDLTEKFYHIEECETCGRQVAKVR